MAPFVTVRRHISFSSSTEKVALLSFRNRHRLSNEVLLSVRIIKTSPSDASFRAFFASIIGTGHFLPLVSIIFMISESREGKSNKEVEKVKRIDLCLSAGSARLEIFADDTSKISNFG